MISGEDWEHHGFTGANCKSQLCTNSQFLDLEREADVQSCKLEYTFQPSEQSPPGLWTIFSRESRTTHLLLWLLGGVVDLSYTVIRNLICWAVGVSVKILCGWPCLDVPGRKWMDEWWSGQWVVSRTYKRGMSGWKLGSMASKWVIIYL